MGLALHAGAIGTHRGQERPLLAQLRLLRDLLHQPGDLRASQDIVSTFLSSYRDASETVLGNHVRVSQLNSTMCRRILFFFKKGAQHCGG